MSENQSREDMNFKENNNYLFFHKKALIVNIIIYYKIDFKLIYDLGSTPISISHVLILD